MFRGAWSGLILMERQQSAHHRKRGLFLLPFHQPECEKGRAENPLPGNAFAGRLRVDCLMAVVSQGYGGSLARGWLYNNHRNGLLRRICSINHSRLAIWAKWSSRSLQKRRKFTTSGAAVSAIWRKTGAQN